MTRLDMQDRLCQVGAELGLFHTWEYYSEPLAASPMIGGAPAGVFSRVFGIVEFSGEVRRVDPPEIVFCDEKSQMLSGMEKAREEKT